MGDLVSLLSQKKKKIPAEGLGVFLSGQSFIWNVLLGNLLKCPENFNKMAAFLGFVPIWISTGSLPSAPGNPPWLRHVKFNRRLL